MSVEYTYDEEKNVIYTRLFGVMTDKDLKDQGEVVEGSVPGFSDLRLDIVPHRIGFVLERVSIPVST